MLSNLLMILYKTNKGLLVIIIYVASILPQYLVVFSAGKSLKYSQ